VFWTELATHIQRRVLDDAARRRAWKGCCKGSKAVPAFKQPPPPLNPPDPPDEQRKESTVDTRLMTQREDRERDRATARRTTAHGSYDARCAAGGRWPEARKRATNHTQRRRNAHAAHPPFGPPGNYTAWRAAQASDAFTGEQAAAPSRLEALRWVHSDSALVEAGAAGGCRCGAVCGVCIQPGGSKGAARAGWRCGSTTPPGARAPSGPQPQPPPPPRPRPQLQGMSNA
jgi:hypothetical protein